MFDELLKELFNAAPGEIICRTLALSGVTVSDLPVELPVTDVRKPDKVWEIRFHPGLPNPLPRFPTRIAPPQRPFYVLNMDFQTENDAEMPLRMLDYNVRIAGYCINKYGFVPRIRQVVIYIGYYAMKMPAKYVNLGLDFGYELLNARDFSASEYLNSEHPAATLFAALAGHDKKTSLSHLERVVERLLAMNLPPVELENYLSRLLTLSHVRRLVVETKNIIERKINLQVSKKLLESDPFYLEGIAEGKREGIAEGKREGIAEGKREGKLETAREMLADGYDIETVMKYTKLTKEEILYGAIGDESSPQN